MRSHDDVETPMVGDHGIHHGRRGVRIFEVVAAHLDRQIDLASPPRHLGVMVWPPGGDHGRACIDQSLNHRRSDLLLA